MLWVRVGGSVCALPLESVGETMRPLPVEALAGTETFVRGLAIVRGEPTPVIDARALLDAPATRAAERFVTLRVGARRAVLAVDAVIGVRAVDEAALGRLPPLTGALARERVSAVGALDGALLLVLDAARLVPEAALGALGVAQP
jgi:purine-binding chemotaxis protein CheW